MLTFCRRVSGRAGVVMRRRHHLPLSSTSDPLSSVSEPLSSSDAATDSSSDHDYLALNVPDPPQPTHISLRPSSSSTSPNPSDDVSGDPSASLDPSTKPSNASTTSDTAPNPISPKSTSSVDELAARLLRRPRGRPGKEAVIAASFGVIRLDSDNTPVVHGQFEPGLYGSEEGERDPELVEAMADRQTPGRVTWRERYYDGEGDVSLDVNGNGVSYISGDNEETGYTTHSDDPFTASEERERLELSIPRGGSEFSAVSGADPFAANVDKSNPTTSNTPPLRYSPSYFDDQYFPESSVIENALTNHTAVDLQSDSVPQSRIDTPPEDVFDEQYFAAAFEPSSAASASGALPVSSPLRGLQKDDLNPTTTTGKSPLEASGGIGGECISGAEDSAAIGNDGGGNDTRVQGKLDGRPEGVFEEQYFWSAFEDMDKQKEVQAYKAGLDAKYSRGASETLSCGKSEVFGEDSRYNQDVFEKPERIDDVQPSQNLRKDVWTERSISLSDHERNLTSVAAAQIRPNAQPFSPNPQPPPPPPLRAQPTSSPAPASHPPEPSTSASLQTPKRKTDATSTPPSGRRLALDVVREMRAEAAARRVETMNRGRQLRAEMTDLSTLPSSGVLSLLRRGVLHDAEDFVIVYKPPGLSIHSATKRHPHCVTQLLPSLAKHLHCDELLTVHRLDRDTSGALLLAKTSDAARRISDLLRENRVLKTYWAIVRGEPELPRGVIDIPVMQTMVAGRERMGLPSSGGGDIPPGAQKAITRYRVLSQANGCSLLELSPATGVKHQLRVHLGLGLACPVLGDHKYSRWESAMKPQRLPPTALAALGLRAPEARHLPLHLHARAIWMPGLEKRVTAPLPLYFKRNLRRLKMAAGKVRGDGSNYGKG